MASTQVNPYASGFQNAGAVGPWSGHDNVVLTGGDTAGIHRSIDKGATFENRDASIINVDTKVASIEPHPSQAGRFFALTGNGTAGSVFETTDYGDTWTDVSSGTPAIFGDGGLVGNSGSGGLLGNGEHPRSVGRLITIDDANGYIYVATFSNGVYRGTLGATKGVTAWTLIGLAPGSGTTGYYGRGILYDPVADKLYVSTFNDPGAAQNTLSGHIWRCSNPRAGSPAFSELTGSPMCGSAMLVISGRLYTVAHPITANLSDAGLWYLNSAGSASTSAAWTKIGVLPTANGERWMSIDGYTSGGQIVLWCGSASYGLHSLCKIVNSGGTWTATIYPTSSTTVKNDIAGPNVPANPWWMYTANGAMMLGKGAFVASTIRINPLNTDEIYVFGRSGAWRSTDGGGNWYPIVKGIGATVTLIVHADPKVQGQVYVGLGDWSILTSKDSLGTVFSNPKTGGGTFSYSLAIDEKTTPVSLIAGTSNRKDTSPTGKVYTNANVLGGSAWLDSGISRAGAIVVALNCCYSGTTRVLIAGFSDGTLFRKVGSNAWTQVPDANMTPSGGINLSGTDTHPLARDLNATSIYLYDRSTGVWRSNDQGLHWTRIWNHPSGNVDYSGWLCVDPQDPTVLYVSDHTSVYKITSANTIGQDAVVLPSTHIVTIAAAIGARGPMVFDPIHRKLGLCDITSTPRFWESALSPLNWVDKSDKLYQNAVAAPQWASYDRNGNCFIALSGNGIIEVLAGSGPSTTPPSITTQATATGTAVEGSILTCDDGATTGNPTPTATRQWQVSTDGISYSNIGGATNPTYTVPTGGTAIGNYYQCVVTWANGNSPNAVSTTNAIGPIVAAGVAAQFTANPVITGTAQEGHTLTCSTGTVTGTPTPTETYQWEQSATGLAGTWSAITGATSNTYPLPVGSAGSFIRCHAHVVNSGGFDDAWATKVGPITPAPVTNPGPATVAIVFPPSSVNSSKQVVQVDAQHPYGIATVEIQLNSGSWQSATFNSATGYWELEEDLTVGINTISARATDNFPG